MKEAMLVIREALDHDSIDEMRRNVIELMKRIFKCDGATFCLSDGSMKTMDLPTIIHNLDEDLIEQYRAYYHKLDPIYQNTHLLPSVKKIEDCIPRAKFEKSEYCKDFLNKFRFKYKMTMDLRSGKSTVGGLALLRCPNSSNFNAHDKKRAETIVPYLTEITKKYRSIQELENRSIILDSVINNMPYKKGIIIFNKHNEPIYIDEDAQKFINFLNEEYNDSNCNITPFHIMEKTSSYLQKHFGTNSWHNLKDLSIHFKMTLSTDKQPIESYLQSIQGQNSSKYLLLCFESFSLHTSIKRTMDEFNLTQREREVAFLVLQGLSNDQISDKLFISRYTVENHLRSIYEKFCVSSRTSLVSKMIGAASLANPPT